MKRMTILLILTVLYIVFPMNGSAEAAVYQKKLKNGPTVTLTISAIEVNGSRCEIQLHVAYSNTGNYRRTQLPNGLFTYSTSFDYDIRNSGDFTFKVGDDSFVFSIGMLDETQDGYPIDGDSILYENSTLSQLMDYSRGYTGVGEGYLRTCLDEIMALYLKNGRLPDIASLSENRSNKNMLEYLTNRLYCRNETDRAILQGIFSGEITVSGVSFEDLNDGMKRLLYEFYFIVEFSNVHTPEDAISAEPFIEQMHTLMGANIQSYIYGKYSGTNTVFEEPSTNMFVSSHSAQYDNGLTYKSVWTGSKTVVSVFNEGNQDAGYIGEYGPAANDGSTITVASDYDGEVVTVVADGGFSWVGAAYIILPDTIVEIGDGAFENARGLQSFTVPRDTSTIGAGAFDGCGSLSSIDVAVGNKYFRGVDGVLIDITNKTLVKYPPYKSGTSYSVPDGIVEIAPNAFQGAVYLEELNFPDSVRKIGKNAVSDCINLKKVDLGNGVEEIGDFAFSSDAMLETFQVSDALSTVGTGILAYTSVESLRVPTALVDPASAFFTSDAPLQAYIVNEDHPRFTAVDGIVFDKAMETLIAYPGLRAGTNYSVPEGVKEINAGAFYLSEYLAIAGAELAVVNLPSSAERIGQAAFKGASITEINFSDGLQVIGEEAFSRCLQLTDVALPEGITQIGTGAFSLCGSLNRVSIPASVRKIGDNVFWDDSNLSEVEFASGSLPFGFDDTTFAWCNPTILGEEYSEVYKFATENGYSFRATSGNSGVPAGLLYESYGDHVIILQYTGDGSEVVIPGIVEGLPVTQIDQWAFYGASTLVSVTIPESVEEIGEYAFANCISLAVVVMQGAPDIADNAFEGSNPEIRYEPAALSELTDDVKPNWRKPLKQGMTGNDVKQLQQKLYDLEYLNVAPTGEYGPRTRAAVMIFQAQHGYSSPNGEVGDWTVGKLFSSSVQSFATQETGASNNAVEVIQKYLIRYGYLNISTATPDFGSRTRIALKVFQYTAGLRVSGKADRSTLYKLYATGAPRFTVKGSRELKPGMSGLDVLSAQLKLYNLGYMPDSPNGYYGQATKAAVIAFQAQNGLEDVTGTVGPWTRSKLNSSSVQSFATQQTGSSNNAVKVIQKYLIRYGYLNIPSATPDFGTRTRIALKVFQYTAGLRVTGKADRSTLCKLYATGAPQFAVKGSRELKPGMSGSDVLSAQLKLYNLGYMTVLPNGYYGQVTKAAVNAFQAQNGLEDVTGTVGPWTRSKLNSSSAKKSATVQ